MDDCDDLRKMEEERDPRVKGLWWVDSRYACGGLITDVNGTIVDSAPIFKTMRGKKIDSVRYHKVKVGVFL